METSSCCCDLQQDLCAHPTRAFSTFGPVSYPFSSSWSDRGVRQQPHVKPGSQHGSPLAHLFSVKQQPKKGARRAWICAGFPQQVTQPQPSPFMQEQEDNSEAPGGSSPAGLSLFGQTAHKQTPMQNKLRTEQASWTSGLSRSPRLHPYPSCKSWQPWCTLLCQPRLCTPSHALPLIHAAWMGCHGQHKLQMRSLSLREGGLRASNVGKQRVCSAAPSIHLTAPLVSALMDVADVHLGNREP